MEQKWTLSKQGMVELQTWLTCHGVTGSGGNEPDRITVLVKPGPKCKFCDSGEVHADGLCIFCHTCLPSAVAHDCIGNRTRDEWLELFRTAAQKVYSNHLLRKAPK